MRRARRSLINIVLFTVVLLLVLYLNLVPSSSGQLFAWSTIRYKTTSSSLPKPHGICPGLTKDSPPALVVSHVEADGDLRWLDKLSARYHLCVYHVDAVADNKASGHLRVPMNRGHEAMAYLTFIIDNFDEIPSRGAVFVHGSRWSWHNDSPEYDNAKLLAALNVSRALSLAGYHNLRCDWSASTCDPIDAKPQGSLETKVTARLEPYNDRAVSDAALPNALATLFGVDGAVGDLLHPSRSQAVRSQCCAQFVVSQAAIWRHPREEYVVLRQWLLDVDKNAAPRDDRIAGRILSYIWHILFIEPEPSANGNGVDLDRLNSLACPSAADCYCRLYGRCDLQGCNTPGHCFGQYTIPPGYKLPADWAATHP